MKTYFKILIFYCLGIVTLQAQVGMTGNNPNKDAVLDLNNTNGSNTKGLLLPKVALTATNSAAPMSAHTAGMKVYNTATAGTGANVVTPGPYYNDGTKWIKTTTVPPWNLTGNSGTIAGTNFIGTIDNSDLVVKTWNIERMRIASTGQLLINATTVPATAGNAKIVINKSTAGALQIKDGTEANGKVLTSDANGVATWKPTGVKSYYGTPIQTAINNSNASAAYQYTGYSISVPVGRSIVMAGMMAWSNQDGYLTHCLSTSPTSNVRIGLTTNPYLAGFSMGASVYTYGNPYWYVNNTTNAPITVYVWGVAAGAPPVTRNLLVDGSNFIMVSY